jgi:hypothetical protein
LSDGRKDKQIKIIYQKNMNTTQNTAKNTKSVKMKTLSIVTSILALILNILGLLTLTDFLLVCILLNQISNK